MTTLAQTGAPVRGKIRKLSESERALYNRIPEDIPFVDEPSFHSAYAEAEFFGAGSVTFAVPFWENRQPESELEAIPSGRSTLSPSQEIFLFLRYNYARFRLNQLSGLQKERFSSKRARRMILWFRRALSSQKDLAHANMALVLAMAKRTRIPDADFGEIISEGNMALLRSIDKFDASLGFKFSTYACGAILKSFHRLASKTGRYRRLQKNGLEDIFGSNLEGCWTETLEDDTQLDALTDIIQKNLACLLDVEKKVIEGRFGFSSQEQQKKTLAEVGKEINLTTERVRQIQKSALVKLRKALYRYR